MITHPEAVRNGLGDFVVDLIDAGVAVGPGSLTFRTAANVAVATLPFNDPAFGNTVAGIATANAITEDTNAAGGEVANFVVQDSDGTPAFYGEVTVTGGGGDAEFDSLTVAAGDTVRINSMSYVAPL